MTHVLFSLGQFHAQFQSDMEFNAGFRDYAIIYEEETLPECHRPFQLLKEIQQKPAAYQQIWIGLMY